MIFLIYVLVDILLLVCFYTGPMLLISRGSIRLARIGCLCAHSIGSNMRNALIVYIVEAVSIE